MYEYMVWPRVSQPLILMRAARGLPSKAEVYSKGAWVKSLRAATYFAGVEDMGESIEEKDTLKYLPSIGKYAEEWENEGESNVV